MKSTQSHNFHALGIRPCQTIAHYPHTQVSLNIFTKRSHTAFINQKIHDYRLTTTPAYTDITHSISPELISMANVLKNGKDVRYLGMVMKVLHDDKVIVHAINPEDPAFQNISSFTNGTRYLDCPDAVERKGGKEWVPGEFVDGVPLNGTPIQMEFFPRRTGDDTEWRFDWFRIDGYKS